MIGHIIVLRSKTGKLIVRISKQKWIEKTSALHLGSLRRRFKSGVLWEEDVENADETHFEFNMDNIKTLGIFGDNRVEYADVVSGDEPIKFMVRISDGKQAAIEPPMLIFNNANRYYPIRWVEHNLLGVCYW